MLHQLGLQFVQLPLGGREHTGGFKRGLSGFDRRDRCELGRLRRRASVRRRQQRRQHRGVELCDLIVAKV